MARSIFKNGPKNGLVGSEYQTVTGTPGDLLARCAMHLAEEWVILPPAVIDYIVGAICKSTIDCAFGRWEKLPLEPADTRKPRLGSLGSLGRSSTGRALTCHVGGCWSKSNRPSKESSASSALAAPLFYGTRAFPGPLEAVLLSGLGLPLLHDAALCSKLPPRRRTDYAPHAQVTDGPSSSQTPPVGRNFRTGRCRIAPGSRKIARHARGLADSDFDAFRDPSRRRRDRHRPGREGLAGYKRLVGQTLTICALRRFYKARPVRFLAFVETEYLLLNVCL